MVVMVSRNSQTELRGTTATEPTFWQPFVPFLRGTAAYFSGLEQFMVRPRLYSLPDVLVCGPNSELSRTRASSTGPGTQHWTDLEN